MVFSPPPFFRRLLPSLFRTDSRSLLDDDMLRFGRAQLLCIASLGMLLAIICINIAEGSSDVLPALLLTTGIIGILLGVLHLFRHSGLVLVGATLTLMLLASYFVLESSTPSQGSLFWFILFPPMLLFCLGIRLGSCFAVAFLLWVLLLFVTPVGMDMSPDLSGPLRARFLSALCGSFLFAWLAEFARYRTQRAFMHAARMLEHYALTDPLTSLGNRRDFENHFRSNQALALRGGRFFCVAMADIDHFKKVNDEHGHTVGDQVLCHVAKVLSANLRQGDTVFRWGGEEFAILMADTDHDNGRVCAERLRKAIEDTPYTGDGLVLPITISFGVYCGALDTSLEDYISEADHRLYLAKKGGRNRVEG